MPLGLNYMSNDDRIIKQLQDKISNLRSKVELERVGYVEEVADGVAKISGLSQVSSNEMLEFITQDNESITGLALNLEEDMVGAVVLGDYAKIKQGDTVKSSGRILSVPVSDQLLSRVIDPLCMPIDGRGPIESKKYYPIEKKAAGVIERESVKKPMQTGIKAIDAMIPIGRGQRELIIGDRQTGKSQIAIDTIINQKDQDVICIYVAIGQKESKIARLVAKLEQSGAMAYTIIVVAGASDPAPMSYLSPYTGAALGEYFMDQGKDVLVVYDDLSKHAASYRQISLILRRPPGREAYPGDVFYLHSRLLERACKLSKDFGGGSITALPIIETQSGDVSAYIPTNVISITDGQIYLEGDLFYQGVRPAVNVGLSVSRVGSAAQTKAMKKVAGKIRLELAQYRELAAFAQFASDLDDTTKKQIERGKRLVEVLKQDQFAPMLVEHQVAIIYAAINSYLDDIKVEDIKDFENKFHEYLDTQHGELMKKIGSEKELTPESEEKLKTVIKEFKEVYQR